MARLLSPPVGLRANRMRKLAGPKVRSSGATSSLDGTEQTFASAFGGRRFQFSFPPLRGKLARRTRGWITAQHGGANATRWTLCDWDGLSLADRGIDATQAEWAAGQNWSNGEAWSNGQSWHSASPSVDVAAASALDATTVYLADDFWGHTLDVGDWLGFYPDHFGAYEITEVIAPGEYRIDLPLRAALTTSHKAYLKPVLAMRMESENAAEAERDAFSLVGLTITLSEVRDYDVRDYFTD